MGTSVELSKYRRTVSMRVDGTKWGVSGWGVREVVRDQTRGVLEGWGRYCILLRDI